MGKKGKADKLKQAAKEDIVFSDGVSEASSGSFARGEWDVDRNVESTSKSDDIDEHIELMSEKRSTVRVDALKGILGYLSRCMTLVALGARREALLSILLSSIKRSSKESSLAARAMGIMALTFGPEEETFFLDVYTALIYVAKHDSDEDTRKECIATLCICCGFNLVDEDHRKLVLNLCEGYFNTECPTGVCCSALEGWGLVATMEDVEFLRTVGVNSWLPVFVDFLDHSDLDVRAAAGENIALIFESVHLNGTMVDNRNSIIAKLRSLSKESSKKNTKRDRKEQRVIFRDIVSTVEDGTEPCKSLVVQHEPLDIEGWAMIKQLEAAKDCLQGGFQEHIHYNAHLRPYFNLPDIDDDRPAGVSPEKKSKVEKGSESNKARCENLKDDRRRRMKQKHAFLSDY